MNLNVILKIAALVQQYGPSVLDAIKDILARFKSPQPVGAAGDVDAETALIEACKKACNLP
jgi:hypothetical protein